MKRARLGLIGTVAIAASLLAGCSDEEGAAAPPAAPPAPAPVDAAPENESEAPASDSEEAPAGEAAAPGTEYSLGDKAVVPYKSGSNEGTIGITISAIEKGTPEDLAPLDLGDKAEGQVPYYIRVAISNEGGEDMAFTSAPRLTGQLPDGGMAGRVSIIGDFEKCQNESAPKDFTAKGASYETCVLAVAPEASSVDSVRFTEGDQYEDAALVWKA
ncbi:hypothetical protein CFN78_04785 [Amycolatopsis antarctica]|uniref:DUF4352 domain-containing protein n=1 Tax=Amycolatopsis antarctica TaxID=1854586 RepID=A0A263D8V4_9PSEU|nr:hypothetical protein [Amycolatopsis antarctica]OZM74438.1 hypothetical protein CFN78_04785 [Amycolatopsis antarctica]